VAIKRFNLATIACDAGDLARACELFAQTLAAEERSLGADHPSTALTRVSFANVLYRLGQTETARAEAGRALRTVAGQPEGAWFRTQIEGVAKQVLRKR